MLNLFFKKVPPSWLPDLACIQAVLQDSLLQLGFVYILQSKNSFSNLKEQKHCLKRRLLIKKVKYLLNSVQYKNVCDICSSRGRQRYNMFSTDIFSCNCSSNTDGLWRVFCFFSVAGVWVFLWYHYCALSHKKLRQLVFPFKLD